MKIDKLKYWLSLVVALAIVSFGSTSTNANLTSKPNVLQPQSRVVAIDFLDAIEGAVQYIQISNISDEQEIAIGKQTNEQVLSEYRLYDNPQIQQYVSNLGQELVSQSDSRDIPFNFQVVVSDQINAFATPGGFVYVTTGLIQAAENRAQLASVMAHEIAHINEKHGVKALKQAAAAQGIAGAAGVETSQLAQIAYQVALDLPQSRSFEYEADRTGLEILQQSGYAPEAFANFLAKLQGGGGTPEFLRTHPSSDNRIEAISQEQAIASQKGQDNAQYRNEVLSLL